MTRHYLKVVLNSQYYSILLRLFRIIKIVAYLAYKYVLVWYVIKSTDIIYLKTKVYMTFHMVKMNLRYIIIKLHFSKHLSYIFNYTLKWDPSYILHVSVFLMIYNHTNELFWSQRNTHKNRVRYCLYYTCNKLP